MSDSERAQPSEATITSKLRDIVIAIHKSGKTDDLTVKRVRARAENELGLDEGFFKTDATWKAKSQEAILDAVDKFCGGEPSPQPTPKKVAPKPKSKLVEKKTKAATEGSRGVKRKAPAPATKAKKRAKTESEASGADLSEPPADISDAESEAPKKPMRRSKKVVTEDSDEDEETSKPSKAEAEDASEPEAAPTKEPDTKGDVSDSELSSVIDEEPVKKKRAPAAKGKKEIAPPKPKKAPKPKAEEDPDTAEVKRLQGWLVKCGIRKVWSRDPELSKCDSLKEKIRVLKGWLKDVGMDGKYSVEKAAKIKEQREFAKDLEAIKEGEAAWGKTNEVTATGRPSRRAAAKPVPQQKIVLEDDSEEEGGGGDEGTDDDDDDDDDVEGGSGDDDGDKSDESGGDDSE